MDDNCSCGHPWSNHYDCTYCLEDGCGCGPCILCLVQFVENPINTGVCINCKELKKALDTLLGENDA